MNSDSLAVTRIEDKSAISRIQSLWHGTRNDGLILFCEFGHFVPIKRMFSPKQELFPVHETLCSCECGRSIVFITKKEDLAKRLSELGGGPIWEYYGGTQRVSTVNNGLAYLYTIRLNYILIKDGEEFHFPYARR